MTTQWFKTNLTNGQQSKRLKLLFAMGVGILTLIFVGSWAVRTGRLLIDLPTGSKKYTVEIIQQANSQQVFFTTNLTADLNKRLPSGNYEVRIWSEDNQGSTYFVSVAGLLHKSITTATFVNQADRQKLARQVSSCPMLVANELYSLECGWSNVLSRHLPLTASEYSKRQNFRIEGVLESHSYRDGLLALQLTNNTLTLSFIKNGTIVSKRELAEVFTPPAQSPSVYHLMIDDKNSEQFVVAQKASSVHLAAFKNYEDTPKVLQLDYGDLFLDNLVSSLDLSSNRMLFVVGRSAHGYHDTEEAKQPVGLTHTRIYKDIFASDEFTEYQTNTPLIKASFCGAITICFSQESVVAIYAPKGEGLLLQNIISQADDFIRTSADTIVYTQANRVYKFNIAERRATLLFAPQKYTITGIRHAPSGVLVNATLRSAANQPITHSFLLKTDPSTGNSFADTALPYTHADFPILWDMDYSNKTILATIILNSAVQNEKGDISYDPKEYTTATQQLLTQLAKDGFSAPDYTIRFQVSN